jgi:hypothetical protein
MTVVQAIKYMKAGVLTVEELAKSTLEDSREVSAVRSLLKPLFELTGSGVRSSEMMTSELGPSLSGAQTRERKDSRLHSV